MEAALGGPMSRWTIYDDDIMRVIVDLPNDQVDALAELCRAQGISRSEAVRRAMADLLAKDQDMARNKVFGAWRGGRFDSRQSISRLREEWGR
jgi:Arc/MetJ-type ribon-helix-helix transcriptional regulator